MGSKLALAVLCLPLGLLWWGVRSFQHRDSTDGIVSVTAEEAMGEASRDATALAARLESKSVEISGSLAGKTTFGDEAILYLDSVPNRVSLYGIPLQEAAPLKIGLPVSATCRVMNVAQGILNLKDCRL